MADGNPRVRLGDNNPPLDPFEAFKAHLDDLRTEAGNWLDGQPIETQAQADEVSRLLDEHRKVGKDMDAARTVEKKPHLDASKAVDGKWKPLIDGADLVAATCKRLLGPWLQRLEDERRAAAEAARKEAEEKARIAAEAARAASGTNLEAQEQAEALVADAKAADQAAGRAEKERAQAHGGARATALRSYFKPVLTDGVIAARHYWQTNREACEAFFLNLAEKDVQAGKRQIPGFDVLEERRVV